MQWASGRVAASDEDHEVHDTNLTQSELPQHVEQTDKVRETHAGICHILRTNGDLIWVDVCSLGQVEGGYAT